MNENSQVGKLTRKEREFQARRKEILAAATRLFARRGYHGTTMNEISREAEFSTGTLYNFFKNKEELYFTLLLDKIEALEDRVRDVYERGGSAEEKLTKLVEEILSFFEVEREFFRIFVEQRSGFEVSSKGEFVDAMHDKQAQYLTNMMKLMEQGVNEGLFLPFEPAELALSFLGILNGFLIVFVNSESAYPLREKGRRILDLFFYGTRKR